MVILLTIVFVQYKLSHNANLHNFKLLLKDLSAKSIWPALVLVFVLMFLNWFLEALKWKFLVKGIEKISLWRAVQSVFCGLTWAIFTPNRVGEYGGRVFFLSPRRRVFGVIAMGIGAVGQMVVTNVLGAIALMWFMATYLDLNAPVVFILCFLSFCFCAFFLLFYFNIKWLIALLNSIPFLKRFKKFFLILATYRKRDLKVVFNFCLARFAVFSFQYYLTIHLLLPQLPVFEMLMMIFILFFIQSALPSLDLVDVGVRTMTATYFFSYITSQEIAIMAATAGMWLVNLIIPAILGTVFVFKLNFFGTNRS